MDQIAPIFAVVFSVGGPVTIAIVAIVISYRAKKKQYDTMLKAIEMGKSSEEVKEIFMGKKEPGDGLGYIRGGIVVVGAGLGCAGIGFVLQQTAVLAPAVFLVILGLSLVLVHYVTRPKKEDQ
jgi:hypothetical protein